MFSRSSSYVFSASKTELKKSGVRYTAQSKKNRIDVQLLKDFPGLGVKGQIIAVKPSAMTNKLYPFNGAVYMNYKNAEPSIPVVSKQEAAAAFAALKNAERAAKKENKVKLNPILKSEIDAKKDNGETLLSLDDLLAIDLNTLSSSDLDLVFSKIPKKLIFVKKSKDNNSITSLKLSLIREQIESVLSKYIRESDVVIKFFNNSNTVISLKSEAGETLDSISKLGTYYVNVNYEEREHIITIVVNSGNN
ncbi:hypothetical protein C6P40_005345 [Pichia californica]|uniref:Ribosomal protein L9 domain-containing protein n=1 Tax=Pichia californica TaxID=460514 RepID=A0A9P7BFS9_9ASCO|nr:hypothetical protein C6P40_005345 [[Candida] californica]